MPFISKLHFLILRSYTWVGENLLRRYDINISYINHSYRMSNTEQTPPPIIFYL